MVYAVVFAFLSFSFTEEDAIGVFRGGYDMGRLYWRLIFCI